MRVTYAAYLYPLSKTIKCALITNRLHFISPLLGNGSSLARPHHIPKLTNSLGKRMDEIRRTMGDGVGAVTS
jgi:hypothetical protein